MKIKHALLPVSLLAFAASASAQTPTPVTTWAQSYGVGSYDPNGNPLTTDGYGSGFDTTVDIVAMPDGGVAVTGYIDLPEFYTGTTGAAYPCAAIVRYAADGHILWQQVLRQDDIGAATSQSVNRRTKVYQMLADPQGNLFVNLLREADGIDNSASGGGNFIAHGAVVSKFSPDGALLWTACYAGDNYGDSMHPQFHHIGAFASMSLTADGGVVVCGGEGSDENTASQPFFFKVNADGSLGTRRAFAPNGSQGQSASVAAQSADGTHFLVAMSAFGEVVLTDSNGVVIAERAFSNNDQPALILANADNTYTLLINGYYTSPTVYGSDAVIVRKLNADLSTAWETSIIARLASAHSLSRTSDGGYLVSVYDDGSRATGGKTGASDFDALALHLDANGKLVSSFALGGPDNEGHYFSSGTPYDYPSVVGTTDGGFALTVTSFSYHLDDSLPHDSQRPDWWTVKTDATGRVHNFKGVMGTVPTTFYPVYRDITPSTASTRFNASPSTNLGGVYYVLNDEPKLAPQDLGTKTGINDPTKIFQAEPATADLHPAFFNGEAALANDVYYLQFPGGNPFGYYSYLSDPHYIYHFDLGYEYVFDADDSGHGVYLYDFKSNGFFYTSPGFPFPYLYDFSLNSVVYYYPDPSNQGRYNTNGVRYFYVYNTGQIISK